MIDAVESINLAIGMPSEPPAAKNLIRSGGGAI
jgi:hypothetical protein